MTEQARGHWLTKFVILAVLLSSTSIATRCTLNIPSPILPNSPTPTPNSPISSFIYQVRVQAKDTGRIISQAQVTIELGEKAPLDAITDVNGLARLLIPTTHVNQPGVLLVEASGYQQYRQYIDLTKGVLPDVVRLEALPTPVPPEVTNRSTSTPTNTFIPPTDIPTATPSNPVIPPANTPTPTNTPVPTVGSFIYQVRVQDSSTDKYVSEAKVTIEVFEQPPLDGITDSNGLVWIFVKSNQAGQPAFLIVEATGYKRYTQYIVLISDTLPDVVLLEPVQAFQPTATPTFTLIPTPTNTSTPAEPPTPPPEAVVIASDGLNLRSGPGTIYDPPIGFLNNGDILRILGRIANNEWAKVLVVNQNREGWVATAPNLVKINVDLNTFPIVPPPPLPIPTPYPTSEARYQFEFGPKLYEPKEWVTYSVGDNVRFTWERFDLKPPAQIYSVRVVLDVEPEVEACIHRQVGNLPDPSRDPELYLDLDCPPGGYYWSVVVATELPEGSEHPWREDSEKNHRNHFGIGVPHPKTPPSNETKPTGELPFIP